MRIGLRPTALAAAVTLALVGLAGCGKTAEKQRAAGVIPGNAIAFLSFNLAPSIEQKLNLQGILQKFPYEGAKDDFNAQLDRALSAAVKESGLNYSTDVKPWLGKEVAVAVLPGTPPSVAALVQSNNNAKAKAALEKAKAKPDNGFEFRMVKDFAVITEKGKTAALDAIARVTTDKSLATEAKFTKVEAELHGDRLMIGWVDGKQGAQALMQSQRAPIPISPEQLLQGTDGFVAFDLHAAKNAGVIEAVGHVAKQQTKPGDPRLTGGLPADSLGAFTVFDLGTALTEGMKLFGGTSTSSFEQQFEQSSGLNLRTDILAWMHGEAVLVAGPAGSNPIPDFGLVVAPSDHAAAEAGLAKLKAAVAKVGVRVIERDIAGAKASVAAQPVFGGIQPAFALYADRFVFASSPAYLSALAKSSSPSLDGTDDFKHAVGSVSSNTSLQILLRVGPIRDAILKQLGGDARASYDRDVARFVGPLEAFGLRAFVDGTLSKFEMKVTFK